MNRRMTGLSAGMLVLGMCHTVALGLDIGDKAPPLHIENWVKGEALDLKSVQGKKVVVVEFWATWCGPCVASIPHLTELQERYRDDVVVIGVTTEDPRNKLTGVKGFVKKQGDKMGYTVAFDDGQRTYDNYMRAAKMNGIPTAFVVDKTGTLIWFGSPFGDLDMVVEQAVAGRVDSELLRRISNAKREIDIAIKLEGWSDAIDAIEQYKAMVNPSVQEKEALDWQVFECLAKNRRTRKKARTFGAELTDRSNDGATLNQYAWEMLVNEDYKGKYNKLALVAAKKANELSGNEDPGVMDTLARALYLNGEVDEAIALQKQAIKLADKENKVVFEESLAEYEGG